MPTQEIEEFARILVREVRDRAIASCDNLLDPAATGVVAKRWREAAGDASHDDFAREAIPDCVDHTLFYLLNAIDTGLLRLSFTSRDGTVIELGEAGQGETAGWYMASGQWRARYSGQRVVDDFSDV